VIAKLDSLSRNLAFLATLMDSGVELITVDNPHANNTLTIHILAAVAQHEREIIGERTKAALPAVQIALGCCMPSCS
jgi:DNA invertase Pin-like site-specific DNA recombinase